MGRRQHRVNGFSPRLSGLQAYVGQLVQVTLHDGRNLRAVLVQHTDETLMLRDANAQWYNRRRHTHILPIAAVQDVVLEPLAEH